ACGGAVRVAAGDAAGRRAGAYGELVPGTRSGAGALSTIAAGAARGRRWWDRVWAEVARCTAAVESWPVPAVLAGLVVVEWSAVFALARTVRHNGWIYYQGGDQLWLYTLGWLLGHRELAQTQVGYGW